MNAGARAEQASAVAGDRGITTSLGPARIWCTDRAGGNVADHVGDDPAVVAANRAALAERVAAERGWVWLRQVHGAGVHVATGPSGSPSPEADAALTRERGLALAIVTADCAPLVLANDDAVAVVHAGHRGLAAGVIEATLARLRAHGSGAVRAFLGPCIRAPRYAFGPNDLERLVEQFGPEVEGRTGGGEPALDIPAAIRVVLRRAGVDAIDDCGVCTADADSYFSYRRDGETGRQATVALLP